MKSLSVVIKESFVVSTLLHIVSVFEIAYVNSGLNKVIRVLVNTFKNSVTYSILHKYACKKPYYRYSFVYRIIMAIAGVFDRLFGFINSLMTGWFSGSRAAEETVSACKAPVEIKFRGFGILFMSMAAGSFIYSLSLGMMTSLNTVICTGVFVLGILCVAISYLRGVFKGSIIVKVCTGLIDLLR